ncbi:MAG: DUF4352 domain-containing protein, partial [Chlorobia bacterium]|nr:DUF4352 domain-containing protein [Fimbriimonadaceae bacterium]
MKRTGFVLALAGITALGITFWGQQVRIEGKVATSDVFTRNGKTYVPLADIAKALGMAVVKTGSGWDLVKPGGANMVQGVKGKVGEELFNGKYRFQVVKVTRVSSYTPQFAKLGYDLTPASSDNEIVAIHCRLKNGTKEAVTFDILLGKNTALTDEKEQSYAPYNGGSVDMVSRAPRVIPGAAADFALTFEVPKDAVLKDLVFSVNDLTTKESPDFR